MKYNLLLLLVAGNVFAGQPEPLPVHDTCIEHMRSNGQMTASDIPSKARGREYNETVVVQFDLDGSGRATNLQIAKSTDKVFNKVALTLVKRAEFTPGVTSSGCVSVRSFTAIRRK